MSKRGEARAEILAVLQRLDSRWVSAASNKICRILSEFLDKPELARFSKVLAWKSAFPGEVDLSSFIDRQIDKRKVYLPKVSSGGSMSFMEVGPGWAQSLGSGYLGISHPLSGEPYNFDFGAETIVLVPGVAFDTDGIRIPRGGGYYERLFGKGELRRSLKVGICFSIQVLQSLPSSGDPVTMDWIVHERGVVRTGVEFIDELDDEE